MAGVKRSGVSAGVVVSSIGGRKVYTAVVRVRAGGKVNVYRSRVRWVERAAAEADSRRWLAECLECGYVPAY